LPVLSKFSANFGGLSFSKQNSAPIFYNYF
jgi:hypothetical protein